MKIEQKHVELLQALLDVKELEINDEGGWRSAVLNRSWAFDEIMEHFHMVEYRIKPTPPKTVYVVTYWDNSRNVFDDEQSAREDVEAYCQVGRGATLAYYTLMK